MSQERITQAIKPKKNNFVSIVSVTSSRITGRTSKLNSTMMSTKEIKRLMKKKGTKINRKTMMKVTQIAIKVIKNKNLKMDKVRAMKRGKKSHLLLATIQKPILMTLLKNS